METVKMKRHFQIHIGTKSFLTFTMIISAVMLVYAAISLYYITGNARKTYLKSADYECGAIADDLGKLYDEINQMTTFLLSEPDVLAAIQYTSKESEGQNSILENRYLSDIRAGLSSYYITKYYYRVSYLNRNGVFVTSSQWISNYSEKEQIQEILQEQFGDEMGKTVEFWGTYSDPWAKQNPEQVVGFVKKISGNQRGFFEVQIEEARFRELFQREFPSRTVLMASLDGERIYQGADGELPDSGGELSDSGGE
ncbi:MAG: hypothetical protein Q4F41_06260, partial [Eubacteriales bacterium]|nr:hypothetical protein [Eubacteriales bacterium]